jgi:ubiquinone/menaquinone biosynthesis C-methylase UbiE
MKVECPSICFWTATNLEFEDKSFDLVCAFGMLHHIKEPSLAVTEALRVARKAVFVSDSNNFGQGSPVFRAVKQTLNACRLWPIANWLKTKGKGYGLTEGDGLAYSYSLFSNFKQIRNECSRVYLFSTTDSGSNLYRSAPCVAALGIKG